VRAILILALLLIATFVANIVMMAHAPKSLTDGPMGRIGYRYGVAVLTVAIFGVMLGFAALTGCVR
jgi:hypothetical protein